MTRLSKEGKKYGKWLEEHPEELEYQNKQIIQERQRENWQEIREEADNMHIAYLQTEINKLENKFRELENMIKQTRRSDKNAR